MHARLAHIENKYHLQLPKHCGINWLMRELKWTMIHMGESFSWGVTEFISGGYNICRVKEDFSLPCTVSLANCHHHSSPAYILCIPLWHLAPEKQKVANMHWTAHSQTERKYTLHTHLHTHIPPSCNYASLQLTGLFPRDVNEYGKLTWSALAQACVCTCVCVCVCFLALD